jgi:hypothetical protein
MKAHLQSTTCFSQVPESYMYKSPGSSHVASAGKLTPTPPPSICNGHDRVLISSSTSSRALSLQATASEAHSTERRAWRGELEQDLWCCYCSCHWAHWRWRRPQAPTGMRCWRSWPGCRTRRASSCGGTTRCISAGCPACAAPRGASRHWTCPGTASRGGYPRPSATSRTSRS